MSRLISHSPLPSKKRDSCLETLLSTDLQQQNKGDTGQR